MKARLTNSRVAYIINPAILVKTNTDSRCKELYDSYDRISTDDSLTIWWNKYNTLVNEVNQQTDSLLEKHFPANQPEYSLYQTLLHKIAESIWMDYYYKNQKKLQTSPPALNAYSE